MTDRVRALLRYGVDTGKARSRTMDVDAFLSFDDSMFEMQTVEIKDGRPDSGRLFIDGQGFELRTHRSAVGDFDDREEVLSVYYPEVEQLVNEVVGTARVFVFDHTLRTSNPDRQVVKQIREPVNAVHNDYTEKSALQRVRDLLPDQAQDLLKRRYAIIQVWRPLIEPLVRAPLAVCDARSISPGDFLPTQLNYQDRKGEIYHIAYNPAHQWFYFPAMATNEALVFKVYDSIADGRARFTAHTAFEDPTTPTNAPPRESIEARCLVFF
jgi:hypothetical protein